MGKKLGNKFRRWARYLQHFFYIAFVILWFKDNFAPLRNLPLHYLFALIPWLGLTAFRLYPKVRRPKAPTARKLSRETAALLLVLLLAIVLRIPFLASPSGLMTSDDAVPALMGKHIAEGKTPPVCFYGQLYMGSLSSHYYALAFKVFGYSIFVLKCATLLVFLAFMAVQFVFLKEVFSFSLALAVSVFYSLPISPLVKAGLDNTSAFALVLLLGSLLLYLSYLIRARSRENLLPVLGLMMGLAFWTHQITAAFIVTSLLLLVVQLRWQFRKYAVVAYWAFLGFLPQLLVEFFSGFNLIPFLMHGERSVNWAKAQAALDFTAGLLTPDNPKAGYAFVILALAGFFSILIGAWNKKNGRTQIFFVLCPAIFYLLYVLSEFSTKGVIRYHYPLYVVLPVLFLAVFQLFSPRLRPILSFALLLGLFFAFNLGTSLQLVRLTKDLHLRITRLAAAMEETGCRDWMGEYWTSYLLTAVSGERLIVDCYSIRRVDSYFSIKRYPPYSLAYWNNTRKDNYVFILWDLEVQKRNKERRNYAHFSRWLETLGIRHKLKEVETARLIYDLEPRIFPLAFFMDPPANIPSLELNGVVPRDGYLSIVFRNVSPDKIDLDFWLNVEIAGFSSRKEWFSSTQREVKVNIPFPSEASFLIRYSIDCMGIRVPSSQREVRYNLPDGAALERLDPVVYLRGIWPEPSPRKAIRMICEKDIWFEVNRNSPTASRLRLSLDSPFTFSSWLWYGKYAQEVDIAVNNIPVGGRVLADGRNTIDVLIDKETLRPGANLVSLRFRYHLLFTDYLLLGPISAFLEKVEVY